MPNGGSDCCGTCAFNEKNKGETGYEHSNDPGRDYCAIRDLPVENPFWTYCANHPHHNPARVAIPVGLVYLHENDSGRRVPCGPAPDSEEIRRGLLALLAGMRPEPKLEYPGLAFNQEVIGHLGELREARAVEGLRRVLSFAEAPPISEEKLLVVNRSHLIAAALIALGRVLGREAAGDIRRYVRFGSADPEDKSSLRIRWGALGALLELGREAGALLAEMQEDPDPELATAVRGRIEQLRGL